MKRIFSILLIVLFVYLACPQIGTVYANSNPEMDTVILSSPDDPYYGLAEEIASAEGIAIYHTLEDAVKANPVFLLWVASPDRLTAEVLINFGHGLQNLDSALSVGILSGKTLADARRLWQPDGLLEAHDYAIVNGSGNTQKITPEIIYGDEINSNTMPLTRAGLMEMLTTTSNFQITIEGAAGSWFDQHSNITITSSDIPPLNSNIIQNFGCSTFRPWAENSIALECIHQGALAYIGFMYPSVVGTRFGDYSENGLFNTWEKFPVGHLVLLQNHATMQSYADVPHFYMLGDPRIYRSSEMPYTMVSDETKNDTRVIQISGMSKGIIPIYIPNGAEFDFVNIPGFASSTTDTGYFNRRLQIVDIKNDKYVVIENQNETITIELKKQAPFLWKISNNTINFIDSVIVDGNHATLYIILIPIVLILLAVLALKKRINKKSLLISVIFGSSMALITLIVTILRKDHILVTNAPITINAYFLLGILVCTGVGLLLYLNAKNAKGKIWGVLIANLYTLVSLIFFGIAMLVQALAFGNALDINKPTYPWLFPLQMFILGSIFYFIAYFILDRLIKNKQQLKNESE